MGLNRHFFLASIAYGLLTITASAGEPNTAQPAEKDPARHTGFLEDIKKMQGTINLVFVGDSITDGWRGVGLSVWDKFFAPSKALNLGISGDATQHVLWRMRHGELDGYEAQLFVIMIGTNNGDSAADVATGIGAIVKEIRDKQPQSRILLLGIFPRGEKPDGTREKNAEVNKIIGKLDDGRNIRFLDIGDKFLEPDKSMSKDIMPDFLHPSLKGYEIWAAAIDDSVKELLKESTSAFAGAGPYKKLAPLAVQIKTGIGLAQVLKTLAAKKSSKDAEEAAEATMMYEALHGGAQQNLDSALSYKDTKPMFALAWLERLSAQFAGDEVGVKAKQAADLIRKDPKVEKELAAEQMFKQIKTFEEGLKPVAGKKDPKSAAFRKLNAEGIATITAGCQQLIQRYSGTTAAQKADSLLSDYR
jgi:lysophospholipase L1-like esterase